MRVLTRYIGRFICLMMLFVVPTLYVNAEAMTDIVPKSPIEVTNFTINKKSLKKGEKAKYSLTIKDIGINDYIAEMSDKSGWDIYSLTAIYGEPPYYYGSDTVYLYWKSSKKQYVVQAFEWNEEDKENGELKISGKIPIEKGMKKGIWRLVAIAFEYNDEVFYVKDSRETIDENCLVPMLDFSAIDFKVSGTGKADSKAPALHLNSMKLSKSYVKNNQKSTFSIKIKDNSKIEEVVCVWDVYDKSNKGKIGDYFEICRMKYNKKTKTYQGSIKLDTNYESKAQLVGIEVRDVYGNEKAYYSYKHDYSSKNHLKKISKYYNAYKNMTVRAK